jgi:hypothetical protein
MRIGVHARCAARVRGKLRGKAGSVMNQLSIYKSIATGLSIGAVSLAVLAACSSGSTPSPAGSTGNSATSGAAGTSGAGGGGSTGGGSGAMVSAQPGTCPTPTIGITFSPMYTSFVTDSTQHTFQVPAVVTNGTQVTWSSSAPTIVALAPDSTTGGIMITVLDLPDGGGPGTVNIVATASDGTCGTSTLTITPAAETDWMVGNARYNDGNSIRFVFGRPDGGAPDGGRGGGRGGIQFGVADASTTPDAGPACTNCHGLNAKGPFTDVAHTPEQTAGFSDQDLLGIILTGTVPDGGYFDPNVIIPDASGNPQLESIAYGQWHAFHHWTDIDPVTQGPGIIAYLRSLAPTAQNGMADFGGRLGDAGPRGRRDGGGGRPNRDGGGSADATVGADDGSSADAGVSE